jgi:hypothetical protein
VGLSGALLLLAVASGAVAVAAAVAVTAAVAVAVAAGVGFQCSISKKVPPAMAAMNFANVASFFKNSVA